MRELGVMVLLSMMFVGCAAATRREAHITNPLPYLSAPDGTTRAAAAWLLSDARDLDEAVFRALNTLENDPYEPAREAATWALSRLRAAGNPASQLTFDTPPEPVGVPPAGIYPYSILGDPVQGTAMVTLLISAAGRVSHAMVTQSVPPLDGAALAIGRAMSFKPATRAGKPVPSIATLPVTFTLR
jgi:TonB family protein